MSALLAANGTAAGAVRLQITPTTKSGLVVRHGSSTGRLGFSGNLDARHERRVRSSRARVGFGGGPFAIPVDGRSEPFAGTLNDVFAARGA